MYGHQQGACHVQRLCSGLSCHGVSGLLSHYRMAGHLGCFQQVAIINSIAASQLLLHLITRSSHRLAV